MSDDARLAVMETELRAHMRSDDERYGRIDKAMSEINATSRLMIEKLDGMGQRIHKRIDEERDDAAAANSAVSSKVDDQRNWIYGGVITALGTAIAVLWDRLTKGDG